MTLKEKIGQLFMFGFEGIRPSRTIDNLIRLGHIGGIILFSRNLKTPQQIANLTNDLQSRAPKIPLLMAIDQEGGRVSRLPQAFTLFPSARTIGSLGSVDLAYRAAECTSKELRAVGINMNFSPVLDIDTNPANPIIGDRSFASKPSEVAAMGLAVTAGLQDNHVAACGKHFPGHGDTEADSHNELPRVDHPISRLSAVELRPFYHAIKNGVSAIMTAHVLYSELDKKQPATLSIRILTGLLREQFGFKGVIVTDDMDMKAIMLEPGEAAIQAVEAGVDLLLYCRDASAQRSALAAVYTAVQEKRISQERIDQSVLRVLRLKDHFVIPYQRADFKKTKSTIGHPSHKQILDGIIERTASRNRTRLN